MDADKIDQMKSGLKKIQAQVNEMSGTAQALGERLERAEQFVMKLGWCPWCQKRLRPRTAWQPG